MKKAVNVIMPIIIMLLVAGLCVSLYYFFTHNNGKTANDSSIETVVSTDAIFSLEDFPKIEVSTSMKPLVTAFIKDFTGNDTNLNELTKYTENNRPEYSKLINGETDIIISTKPSEQELKLASDAGVELELIPIVKEGLVFYVNINNPLNDISLDNIKKIYTGNITNWSELGGNNEEIIAFQKPNNSESQIGMISLVMNDLKFMDPPSENNEENINLISNFDNNISSIGYAYYTYVTMMYDTIDSGYSNSIKLLKVDGIEPNYNSIKDGKYPIITEYYIITRKDGQSENTKKLIEAILSERGKKVIK